MNYQIDTKCIQSGYAPKNGEPRVVPIYQSTTFRYDNADEMGKLFDLEADGFFYSRLANPTVAAVEAKIADLEGGVGAMLVSSGQSATFISILNICHAGGHVVSSSAIYGGSFNLLNKTMREMGIDITFVSPDATDEELDNAFKENTRCVFGETISNPSLNVLDLEQFANAAHRHGVPLIIDNTFATPANCRPFEFGADIVIHSTTKYMDGHAVALGGVIVDSGNFNWDNGKYPMLTEPDESYHGISYTGRFGKMAYIVKARAHLMRDLGCMMSPNTAFLLDLGLQTLTLRMEKHCSNACKVAAWLKENPKVAWVEYPGLADNKDAARVQKYLPNGTCGVISFGLVSGREGAVRFMDSLKLASIETHVADCHTCVLHPASTTHRQMTDEQLVAGGVRPDLLRFSVGIENPADIIADIQQALDQL